MKKSSTYILLAILLVFIIVGTVIYNVQLNTSFTEEVVSKTDIGKIDSIEIISSEDNQKVIVKDAQKIKAVMNKLTSTELKKSSAVSVDNSQPYWLTITENGVKRFGIILYGDNYMSIYDEEKTKNNLNSYTITNQVDFKIIRDLLKKN